MDIGWLDIILDKVSKYELRNITKTERDYLDCYPDTEELEEQLEYKMNYYEDICKYKIKESYYFDSLWMEITDEDLRETRLNMLWDNMEMEDTDSFAKIYKVPYLFLNLNWNNLPTRYKTKFEDYWKSYYNLFKNN